MIDNEREVVIGWKSGNKKSFEMLVRHYMSDAYAIAYGFVSNRENARDLSQDAFIKAYQARDSFDVSKPFFPWLYKILKNHCLNFLKRSFRNGGSLYYEDNPDRERFASPASTPLQVLERDERKQIVHAAIGLLSEDHREIIVLKNFQDHSYTEIAEILDVPIGTVMSRLYYARKTLKELIEQIEAEGFPESRLSVAEGNPTPGEVP